MTTRYSCSSSNPAKVLFDYQKNTCFMILNNPKAFNALDLEMLDLINEEISNWESTKNFPSNLVIKSDHPKAFCAGGDVVSLLHMHNDNAPEKDMLQFFKTEFEVDFKLANLAKQGVNTIALWDGIIMGGGVGLSSGCQYKVATEKTMYAMPETRIGLFVDVAISYYLTKLNNGLGRYMAIMGHRLKGGQVFQSGLANTFVPHNDMKALEEMIVNLEPNEVKEYMMKQSKYEVSGLDEIVDWMAFNCVVKEVLDEMNNDVRNVIFAHESLLNKLNDQKIDFSKNLKELSDIIPQKFVQGFKI